MLIKERQGLEAMKSLADYYFENTKDPWYEKMSVAIEKKLRGKK